jgi:hypothetical protein
MRITDTGRTSTGPSMRTLTGLGIARMSRTITEVIVTTTG